MTTRQAPLHAINMCELEKSFFEFDYCNNRLKLVLPNCKQFCSLKRCDVCYSMDFSNTFHDVTCFCAAQKTWCFALRCIENDYAVSEHFWDNKLFIPIVFYKYILCFEGASSELPRCKSFKLSAVNLNVSNILFTPSRGFSDN